MRVYILIISIVCIVLNFNVNANAEILCTDEEAVDFIFPNAQKIKIEEYSLSLEQKKRLEKKLGFKLESSGDMNCTFYIGLSDSEITGYACINTVRGKRGPIRYIVGLTPEGKVKDLAILSFQEMWGRKIKERNFLDQFINSFYTDTLRTEKRIHGITSASISTQAMINGVKKVLLLYNEFYAKNKLVKLKRK